MEKTFLEQMLLISIANGASEEQEKALSEVFEVQTIPQWRMIRTWKDEPLYDCMEDIPVGWRRAFGQQMVDELDAILNKYNYADKYVVAQVKEKFGELRWYDCGIPVEASEEYNAWLTKYEELSVQTCISCGEPGIMRNDGWLSPYCNKCYGKAGKH